MKKALLLATLMAIFSGCSWQSILTFGLIKSDEEILEQKAKDELENTKQTCIDKNNAIACNNAAVSYSELKDFKNAREFYKRSCELNLATACSNLGQIYEHGLVDEQRDENMALAYYKLGCQSKDGVGCYNEALLRYNQDRQNFKQTLELLKKSCLLEYKQACVLLEKLK
ncbi:tetratricopeptide repeat protein [Campylobacter mucosalis]|uniref:beta-lactamase n=1 Tax=Campylobacter mucosalis CCUG 21559 TaxID=1032067 RepID=A0A6G5QHZ4_9BACT|nr:tetratricopeptide repeat protein [Campylobacter mucosalis]QCD45290.1 Sel1 domain repeat-containing protein [Campylobacter mucosalis CCUG 21559]